MALSAYLSVVASRQGLIEGSVTQHGREGTMEVTAISHVIVAPRDPATGRPKGKRMHKPLVVTKVVDQASPALHFVLTQNENLERVLISLYRPSPTGAEELSFTIRLHNATLCSIHTRMLNNRTSRHAGAPLVEELHFVYQRISWLWTDGSVLAEDDWDVGRIS